MPSSRITRAATEARSQILASLKDDHKRVKKAYKDFLKLDAEADPEACQALVLQVLDELTVHAAVEEELLYPAARGAVAEVSLIDEAEVEHESLHALIDQLRAMSPEDEKYAARFTVLCEYVLHHVKEEEGEMFPQLEKARLDWQALATEMTLRRQELMPAETLEEGDPSSEDEASSSHSAAGRS
jgi:hemerythrin superfamily protein